MSMNDILNAYRPETFDMVCGQTAVVRSIKAVVESDNPPHAFLFHGPSGVGKTTVARIVARELGCNPIDLVEVDAASNSGVESTRKLSERQKFQVLNSEAQVTIIDECHALSAAAWKALLKPLEDAPEGCFWILCTTEIGKVPKTVRTRCHEYGFKPVPTDELFELLADVAEEEEIGLDKKALDAIVKAAQGSPRQALAYLSACRSCETLKEVQEMIRSAFDNPEIIDLVRLIVWKKPKFADAVGIVSGLKDSVGAESIRLTILSYCASCLMSKPDNGTERLLAVMEEFEHPFNDSEKMAPVILALGRLLLT